jgi:hypothetical protein
MSPQKAGTMYHARTTMNAGAQIQAVFQNFRETNSSRAVVKVQPDSHYPTVKVCCQGNNRTYFLLSQGGK